MDCTQAREEFSALLDGELAPDDRAAVEIHLSNCSDCLRELDSLKRVDGLFSALSPQAAPEDFEEQIRLGLKPRVSLSPAARLTPRRLWPLLMAAAGLLVLVSVWVTQKGPGVPSFELAKSERAASKASAPQGSVQAEPPRAARQALVAQSPDTDLTLDAAATSPSAKPEPPADDAGVSVAFNGILAEEQMTQAPSKDASPETPTEKELGKSKERAMGIGAGEYHVNGDGTKELPEQAQTIGNSEKGIRSAGDEVAEAISAESTPVPSSKAKTQQTEPDAKRDQLDLSKAARVGVPTAAPTPPLPARDLAGRRLLFQNGVWTQDGYQEGSSAAPPTRIERDTEALAAMLAKHPELKEILALDQPVIVRVETSWYRIEPEKAPAQASPAPK